MYTTENRIECACERKNVFGREKKKNIHTKIGLEICTRRQYYINVRVCVNCAPYHYISIINKIRVISSPFCAAFVLFSSCFVTKMTIGAMCDFVRLEKNRQINWCTKFCMQQIYLHTISNVSLWHTDEQYSQFSFPFHSFVRPFSSIHAHQWKCDLNREYFSPIRAYTNSRLST